MRKIIILTLAIGISINAMAQESGIRFFKGNWDDAIAQAQKENKNIFIDFYTEWCGPCLSMAQGVFKQPEVGEVYNKNFVNIKIDAEKGEGVELAKKYGVRSYPTYIFVDPKTGKMTHRSGGNKPVVDFIADAKGALNPKLSSIYLEAKYESDKYDASFLKSYIAFKKASGARDQASQLFDELIAKGAKLTEKDVWELFVDCVVGYDNSYLREVSDNYAKYSQIYGKEAVDSKLESATTYAPEVFIKSLCDFNGKEQNLKMRELTSLFSKKDYSAAFAKTDELLSDSTIDNDKLLSALSFHVRVNTSRGNDDTIELLAQKVKYLKIIAYNTRNRDDARVHFDYATGLELLITRATEQGIAIPSNLLQITLGKAVYDMRHPDLKQKPKRQSTSSVKDN